MVGASRRQPLRVATLIALVLALAITGAVAWAVYLAVRDQEQRLLKERTAERGQALHAAMGTNAVVPTGVIGSARLLGFALGSPAAPAGTVLYRESALGPVAPPRQAGTAPFSELDVVLYATPNVDPNQVLVS